jgi:response regulator RpfG family c-di-GMP phosphodiesterase
MNNVQGSILIVDDEEPVSELMRIALSPRYSCTVAASADEAIALFAEQSFDLVLADITLPGMSGLELCSLVSKTSPDTVVVMVSGLCDIQSAIKAMHQGAFDYVVKPFELSLMSVAVERALRHQALLSFKHRYERSLEETVRARTLELRLLNDNLKDMIEILYSNYRATLRALAKALEARDVETHGHTERVVAYCLTLGRQLGLTQRDLIVLEQGALLHDIGKIGVRDSILLKPGPLTDDQWVEMRAHIDHGLEIINGVDFLAGARSVVGQHHEKFDGSGYPNSLAGEAIHLHARIFAVADAFDALTSDRPYRGGRPYAQACEEIVASAGTHFDPKVVDAFLTIPEARLAEIRRDVVQQRYTDQIIDEREMRSFIVSLKHPGVIRQSPALADLNLL